MDDGPTSAPLAVSRRTTGERDGEAADPRRHDVGQVLRLSGSARTAGVYETSCRLAGVVGLSGRVGSERRDRRDNKRAAAGAGAGAVTDRDRCRESVRPAASWLPAHHATSARLPAALRATAPGPGRSLPQQPCAHISWADRSTQTGLSRTESNREPSRAEPGRAVPCRAVPSRTGSERRETDRVSGRPGQRQTERHVTCLASNGTAGARVSRLPPLVSGAGPLGALIHLPGIERRPREWKRATPGYPVTDTITAGWNSISGTAPYKCICSADSSQCKSTAIDAATDLPGWCRVFVIRMSPIALSQGS